MAKKTNGIRRTVRLEIQLSNQERDIIEQAADRDRRTPADYVRTSALIRAEKMEAE